MARSLITDATSYAIAAHGDQMYGRKPYHVHLADVVNVLRRFVDWDDLPQEFIDAAWLHDVLEDTDTQPSMLKERFGSRVLELVSSVTNEPGANRKEKHEKTYPKIIATDGAIIIKLADRIANIEQTISHDRYGRPPQKIFGMYDKEFEGFRSALRFRCKNSSHSEVESMMWDYLEELIEEGRDRMARHNGKQAFRGGVDEA